MKQFSKVHACIWWDECICVYDSLSEEAVMFTCEGSVNIALLVAKAKCACQYLANWTLS